MIVADIGNSDIVIAYFDNEKLSFQFRINSYKKISEIELSVKIKDNFLLNNFKSESQQVSAICSVVPELEKKMQTVFVQLFKKEAILIKPGMHSAVKVKIEKQEELGSDLYANAVYAFLKYHKPCVIVDFGTALSFTAVSANGNVEGVAIAPGLKTAVKALFANTAQLPEIKLELPETAIGKDTITAIRSGILIGYEGLVKNLIYRMKEELGAETVVLATGGLSLVLHSLKNEFNEINRDLTLQGIRMIAEAYR